MATSGPCCQFKQLLGLPPLSVMDPPTPSEPDYPSLGNQSPRSHTKSVWTSHDSILPEDFFIEGFIPPFNPPITNLLGPLLIPVAPLPHVSSAEPIPTIPLMTNGSWDFVDTFGPPLLPKSTVNDTPLMENPAIPTVLGLNHIVTPNASGT